MPFIRKCPFCGSDAELLQTGKNKMKIRCKLCHIGLEQKVLRLSMDWLAKSLIITWNKRVENND
jgi:transcription elongation factor Elf1